MASFDEARLFASKRATTPYQAYQGAKQTKYTLMLRRAGQPVPKTQKQVLALKPARRIPRDRRTMAKDSYIIFPCKINDADRRMEGRLQKNLDRGFRVHTIYSASPSCACALIFDL